VPEFPPERESVYQLYNLRFDDEATRDGLREHLDDLGVPTRITYDPVHLTRFYRDRGWTEGDLPVTEEVSNHILTLPFHLNLDDDDLTYIVDSVRSYFDGV
jgi:perosamine synthetase